MRIERAPRRREALALVGLFLASFLLTVQFNGGLHSWRRLPDMALPLPAEAAPASMLKQIETSTTAMSAEPALAATEVPDSLPVPVETLVYSADGDVSAEAAVLLALVQQEPFD